MRIGAAFGCWRIHRQNEYLSALLSHQFGRAVVRATINDEMFQKPIPSRFRALHGPPGTLRRFRQWCNRIRQGNDRDQRCGWPAGLCVSSDQIPHSHAFRGFGHRLGACKLDHSLIADLVPVDCEAIRACFIPSVLFLILFQPAFNLWNSSATLVLTLSIFRRQKPSCISRYFDSLAAELSAGWCMREAVLKATDVAEPVIRGGRADVVHCHFYGGPPYRLTASSVL